MRLDKVHERTHQPDGDLVRPVVVVAVLGVVALDPEVGDDAVLIADGIDLGVPDRGQTVRCAGESRNARGEEAAHGGIVQRHLQRLVAVLIVHVVDDVEGVDVQPRQPAHHLRVFFDDLVVVERTVPENGRVGGRDLHGLAVFIARDLVLAAVDRVQQALGKVCPCAEELHVLAHAHARDAARDAVVVPHLRAHQIVALVLDGGRLDGDLRTEVLEALGKAPGPKHREIGFGRGSEVLQRMQDAEAVLGDERSAVRTHAADALRDPGRIAAEQLVVLLGAHELDDAQLHDKVVDELLRLRFRERPLV